MSKRSSDHGFLGSVLSRMDRSAAHVAPSSPHGPCALCGNETTYADSLVVSAEREHYDCRRRVREHRVLSLSVDRDFLRVAEVLGEEGVLFRRLERRLAPFLEARSVAGLCRLVTFCLAEIARDPSIRPFRKQLLRGRLGIIRTAYLPAAN